jgi:hypothetical protein
MKRKIKISGSVSGVIATGSYANLRPSFTWEEEFDIKEEVSVVAMDEADIIIQARRQKLYEMSFALLKQAESKALIERIEREREDLRFVAHPETGKISPSVTSIINFDADFFVSAEDLRQYASQGSITHARVNHYIATGEWVEAKQIKDVWVDMLILKKGSLKLPCDVGDFPGFLDKHKIVNMQTKDRIFSEDGLFNGELDFTGEPEFKGSIAINTVFDVKRTPDKVKNGMQLSAYCKMANCKQGIIVLLNDKTGQGYSKPIVYGEDALKGYFSMFMKKREEFRKRYGI